MCQIEWRKAQEMKDTCIKLHWRFLKIAQEKFSLQYFPSCDALKWCKHTIIGVLTVLNDQQNSLSTKMW